MEGLSRLVAESLARHGISRPLDYRRLQWSRWFRCESPHSLLLVPSKPGIFALAEEIVNFTHVGEAASAVPATRSEAAPESHVAFENQVRVGTGTLTRPTKRSEPAFPSTPRVPDDPETPDITRRMLAVLRFCEAEDMAFVLDRMFAPSHPMRSRLAEGHCFVRFVSIQDAAQRATICSALNQWMISSADRVTGATGDFTSSLGLTPSTLAPAPPAHSVQLDSGSAANIHCPSPFPLRLLTGG